MGRSKNEHRITKKVTAKLGQSFDKDGVGVCGRLGSLFGVLAVALYACGVMMQDWLVVDQFGHPGLRSNGLEHVRGASFGLRGYCLSTNMSGFLVSAQDIEESSTATTPIFADVCFTYKQKVKFQAPLIDLVTGEDTGEYFEDEQDGCTRLNSYSLEGSDPCKKRNTILFFMIGAMSTAIIGSMYSEKPLLNGLLLFVSGLSAVGAITLWMRMAHSFEDVAQEHTWEDDDYSQGQLDLREVVGSGSTASIGGGFSTVVGNSDFKKGRAFTVMIGGAGVAFLAAIMGMVDGCVCIDAKRKKRLEEMGGMCSCADDSVGFSGRFGALIGTLTWICFLASVATNDWITTDHFGSPGCFCSNPTITNMTDGCMGKASLGLWEYCMYPLVPQYGNEPQPVCFNYQDAISTAGPSVGFDTAPNHNCTGLTATGLERFSEWGFQGTRGVVGWCLIGSIVLIMVADIFSEKLMLCCLLNLAATGLGFFSMFLWIGFFEKLALATDSRLKMGVSGFLLLGGWGASLVAAGLYGKDWICNTNHHLEITDKDGNVVAKKDFDGNDIKGDVSSDESDGSDEEEEEEKKKKKSKKKKKKKKKKKDSSDESSGDSN